MSAEASELADSSDAPSQTESADASSGDGDVSSEEAVSISAEQEVTAEDLQTAAEGTTFTSAQASELADSSDAPSDTDSADASSGDGDASSEEAVSISAEQEVTAEDLHTAAEDANVTSAEASELADASDADSACVSLQAESPDALSEAGNDSSAQSTEGQASSSPLDTNGSGSADDTEGFGMTADPASPFGSEGEEEPGESASESASPSASACTTPESSSGTAPSSDAAKSPESVMGASAGQYPDPDSSDAEPESDTSSDKPEGPADVPAALQAQPATEQEIKAPPEWAFDQQDEYTKELMRIGAALDGVPADDVKQFWDNRIVKEPKVYTWHVRRNTTEELYWRTHLHSELSYQFSDLTEEQRSKILTLVGVSQVCDDLKQQLKIANLSGDHVKAGPSCFYFFQDGFYKDVASLVESTKEALVRLQIPPHDVICSV